MLKSKSLYCALALLAPALVHADKAELYGQFGTEGFGAGFGYHLTERQALRVEANTGSVSRDLEVDENDYDVDVDAENYGAFYDFYPSAQRGFRLTVGIASLQTEGRGSVTGDAVVIDGVTYPLGPGDELRLTVEPERSAAPYVGIGFGRSLARSGRFGVFADLGVFFTSFESRLYASPSLTAQIDAALAGTGQTAADVLAAEQADVQDEVDNYKVYPVLKLGVTYRF